MLVTGHTGFKGGWLALWLGGLGAKVTGYALDPVTAPSLFETAGVAGALADVRGDIRDAGRMGDTVRACDPEVVFHLAARAIVREAYADPVEAYSTNVVGTATVLDACRAAPALRAIVCVTSDKCYENREWEKPYREDDRLGGRDPYGSSKACTELVAHAYRRSYFEAERLVGLATARAGNVIGGGDWAADRLVPDLARAARVREPALIRNPSATRPWQHVLEPLSGYLALAERLAAQPAAYSEAWNFGPDSGGDQPVGRVVEEAVRLFQGELQVRVQPGGGPHEATRLMLDSSKARARLDWRPRLGWAQALRLSVDWYRQFAATGGPMRALCEAQISNYTALPHAPRTELPIEETP